MFFERAIDILKKNGNLGFITPNTYLTNKYIKPLREFILSNTTIDRIVNHDEIVFSEASVDVATIILRKLQLSNNEIKIINNSFEGFFDFSCFKKQKDWIEDPDKIFNLKENFFLNTSGCVNLGNICNSYFGIQAYDRKSSISTEKENEKFLPIIDGGDIFPYKFSIPSKFFNFIEDNIKSGGDYKVYNEERIVIRQIGQTPIVGLCDKNILGSNTLYNINLTNSEYSLKYILAVLNSKLIKKYWISMYSDSKQLFPKIKGYQLKNLPIKIATKEQQIPFTKKADLMLDLHKQLQEKANKFIRIIQSNFAIEKISTKLESFHEHEFKTFVAELKKQKVSLSLKQQDEWEEYFNSYKKEINDLQAEINKTDAEIDQMVYKLYELSEEEIKVVEGK